MTPMSRWLWVVVGGALLVALVTPIRAEYVLAPLLGVVIWWIGVGSLASLRRGAAHLPSGDPTPLDLQVERITYWCEGCGAELLLLVRGTDMPPRHCGERMTPHTEVLRDPRG